MTRQERAAQRSQLSTTLFRPGDSVEAFRETENAYWRALSIEQRCSLAWELSLEQWKLAGYEEPREPRLSRSVVRIFRR